MLYITAHYDLLVSCHDYLVDGLESNLSTLSSNCFSKLLITEDTYKKTMQLQNMTDRDKVRMVLLNVQDTIKENPEKFDYFVTVLKELSCTEHLLASLQVSIIAD